MSGWTDSRIIETKALSVLLPYLDLQADSGRLVITSKGTLSKRLQEIVGDAILNDKDGVMWTIELKAEEKHTGNLFLETWSNKNLDDKLSHAERGSNPGWMQKLTADLLLYYFIDTGDLYSFSLFNLKRWAFGYESASNGPVAGRIYTYREVKQRKNGQLNDTWGRIVPLSALRVTPGYKHTVLTSEFTSRDSAELMQGELIQRRG